MEKTDKAPHSAPLPETSRWSRFSEEFYLRYMREIWITAAVVVVAVVGYFAWSQYHAKAQTAANKKLGEAYVLLRDENLPAAEAALKAFLATGPSGIAEDKANLYLGKVYYSQQRYDESLAAYSKVGKGKKAAALIYSGALHGRAAASMQKKDYAAAVPVLEELVEDFGERTGDPEENLDGEEVVDRSPNVPNALFKLALCYRELGQTDKAKAAAEKLARVYPETREGKDAEKLLVLLN
jgi:TolA-binding protein